MNSEKLYIMNFSTRLSLKYQSTLLDDLDYTKEPKKKQNENKKKHMESEAIS